VLFVVESNTACCLLFTVLKRLFDIVVSAAGLLVLSPVMILIALLIKLDSRGPVFFKQERIGKDFRPFVIYKFRTMIQEAPQRGAAITVGEDPRITRAGRFLRKSKLDELAQLLNVLKGDMSLVGPRPEVPRYVEMFHRDYEEILTVRPGITDLASLKYRHEAAILAAVKDPEQEYMTRLLPEKIMLAKQYIRDASFLFDLRLIFKTLFRVVAYEKTSRLRA
jgi:lipopolysaccharide/colanic/teichoic acid biosynthesis glycosyltransferase